MRLYCQEEKNTTNDKHSIPLFEIFSRKPREDGRWMVKGFGWITFKTAENPITFQTAKNPMFDHEPLKNTLC